MTASQRESTSYVNDGEPCRVVGYHEVVQEVGGESSNQIRRRGRTATPERRSCLIGGSYAQDADNPAQSQADSSAADAPGSDEAPKVGTSRWISRIGRWSDYGAGFRVIDDRENWRMMIKFDEKPSKTRVGVSDEWH
jgi:hypothetical protein